jgi:hypothetical protein
MCNMDEIAMLVPSLGIRYCDTCCFSQSISITFFPLLIVVMSLTCLWSKFINIQ